MVNEIPKNLIDIEQNTNEPRFVSFEENIEIARKLLEKYNLKMRENLNKNVDGWGEVGGYQKSMKHFFGKISEDVLKHYYGHGVTRGDDEDRLASILNIAINKSIKGTIANFSNQMSPYINADFVIISQKDKEMDIRETKSGKDYSEVKLNEDGSMQVKNIGAIAIDVKYYPLFDELKTMFPDVNFIKANQIPEYFQLKNN